MPYWRRSTRGRCFTNGGGLILITSSAFDFQTLLDNGRTSVMYDIGRSTQVVDVEYEVYNIANNGTVRLDYQPFSNIGINLQSGARATGKGFLLSKDIDDSNIFRPLSFYPYQGKYSDLPNSDKQNLVDIYNEALLGEITETAEDVGVVPERLLNERGETVQEENARLEVESRTGLDGIIYDTVQEKDKMDRRMQNTKLNESLLIREWEETLVSQFEFGGIQETARVEIIEITTGTVNNPVVQYRVDEINTGATLDNLRVKYSLSASTQEEAETIFDSTVERIKTDFQVKSESAHNQSLLNQTTSESLTEVEVFFSESNLSFEQMLTQASDFEYLDTAFRNARESDVDGARPSGLKTGSYGDAISFSNNGNTLNLDDFDSPRITTEGITENKSAAVAFTVKVGWKISFRLEIEDWATFIDDAADEVDIVSRDGNSFDFIMYGGDRLEIDIDNEYNKIHPLFVSSKGRKWSSVEEIDDEVSLTMMKAERLEFNFEEITRETYVQSGDIKSETVTSSLSGPVTFSSGPLTESGNLQINSLVNTEIKNNPEYEESMFYTRSLGISDVTAESSFITPEELTEPVTDVIGEGVDAIGDTVTGIWDGVKWWILGGVILISVVILGAVYINGRAKSPSTVQVQTSPAPMGVRK